MVFKLCGSRFEVVVEGVGVVVGVRVEVNFFNTKRLCVTDLHCFVFDRLPRHRLTGFRESIGVSS